MGCIRVEKITEYLTTPLRQTLKDSDPYVRKTAAVCVAKLFDISPELVSEQGFLDQLHDMVSDSNPMVVANAVAALTEIHDSSEVDVLRIDSGSLRKLLVALNENVQSGVRSRFWTHWHFTHQECSRGGDDRGTRRASFESCQCCCGVECN